MPRHAPGLAAATCLTAFLLLPACGGGSPAPGGTIPSVQAVVIKSEGAMDGYLTTSGGSSVGAFMATGDYDATFSSAGGARGFVTFEHAAIPNGVVIQSIVLRLYVTFVHGNPIGELGNLVATHVDIGPTLEPADIAAGVIAFNIGALMTDSTLGWKQLDVTQAFGADVLAGRTRTQFRIEHQVLDLNNDGTDDAVNIVGGLTPPQPALRPEIVVTYELP